MINILNVDNDSSLHELVIHFNFRFLPSSTFLPLQLYLDNHSLSLETTFAPMRAYESVL